MVQGICTRIIQYIYMPICCPGAAADDEKVNEGYSNQTPPSTLGGVWDEEMASQSFVFFFCALCLPKMCLCYQLRK